MRSSTTSHAVAVVGAGLAGLTAAHRLRQAGVDVVVVEARDRIGGRAFTVRDGVADGQHLDLGGEIVDETYGVLRALCGELGVELSPEASFVRPGASAGVAPVDAFLGGGRVLIGDDLLDEEVACGLRREIGAALEVAPPDDGESLSQWQQRARASENVGRVLAAMARLNPMRDPWQTDPYYALTHGWGDSFTRLRRGTGALADALAVDLDVRLEHDVLAVRQRGGSCTLTTSAGELEAEHVILTAPLRVLPEIGFDPPLEEARIAAILAQAYALGGKVVAQYAEGDALREALPGACLSTGPISAVWLNAPYLTAGPAVVSGFAAGALRGILRDPAAALAELDRIVERVLGRPATRIAGDVKDWTADPHARAVGSPPSLVLRDAIPVMSAPHGRVVFAGDHADIAFYGTLEGAVRSGVRAAAEVLGRPARMSLDDIAPLVREEVAR